MGTHKLLNINMAVPWALTLIDLLIFVVAAFLLLPAFLS